LRTKVIGHPLVEFPTVESTNTMATGLLRRSAVRHGAVVLAHEQTAGRGQRGRSWRSQPGLDLALSIVLEPVGLRAEEQFGLAKVAALAVHDTVRAHVTGPVTIKWPNDLLIGRNKVAGILIACELTGDLVRSAIVGIGLNVNSDGFEQDLVATSLMIELGGELDRMAVLGSLCERFETRWEQWEQARQGGGASLDSDYAERLHARSRWASLVLDGQPITARPLDVDPAGRLIVEHEDGRTAAYALERLRFAPR